MNKRVRTCRVVSKLIIAGIGLAFLIFGLSIRFGNHPTADYFNAGDCSTVIEEGEIDTADGRAKHQISLSCFNSSFARVDILLNRALIRETICYTVAAISAMLLVADLGYKHDYGRNRSRASKKNAD